MFVGSEVVVGTSITTYDLKHETCGCDNPPPRLRTASEPSHHSITLLATSKCDSELKFPQGHVKYAMLGGSEVVVGINIAFNV